MLWDGNGQGFATEAGLVARDYAYNTVGLTTLISSIAPDNVGSMRVASRMNAWREAKDYEHPVYGPLVIFRHPGPDGRA